MRIDTEDWGWVKWVRRKLNIPPKFWWNYHHPKCGTMYRGCAPECPKDIWERTKKWTRK